MAFGGSLAQSSVVPSWSIGGVMPDLPLIMTALVALRRGPETGCLVGFASGLFQDAASGSLLGVQALSRGLAGFAVGLLPGRFCRASPRADPGAAPSYRGGRARALRPPPALPLSGPAERALPACHSSP